MLNKPSIRALVVFLLLPILGLSHTDTIFQHFTDLLAYTKTHPEFSQADRNALLEQFVSYAPAQERVRALHELGKGYMNERLPDKLATVTEELFDLAHQLNDTEALSDAYYLHANRHFNNTRIREGLAAMRKSKAALAQLEQPSPQKTILILAGLGYWYGQVGDFEAAFLDLHEALELSQEKELAEYEIYLLTLLSNVSAEQGDYRRALSYEQTSLQRATESGDESRILVCRNNIADLYVSMGDYTKALEAAAEIEQKAEQASDIRIIAGFQHRMGLIYLKMNKHATAQRYFDLAYKNYETSKDRGAVAKLLCEMTPLWIAQQQNDEALRRLDAMAAEMTALGDTVWTQRCYMAQAQVLSATTQDEAAQVLLVAASNYFNANDFREDAAQALALLARSYRQTQQTALALATTQQALTEFEAINNRPLAAEMYELTYLIHKDNNNLADALASHEKYMEYTESIKTEIAHRRLMEERVRFNTQALEDEKARIATQNATLTERNRLYIIICVLLLFGGIMIFGQNRKLLSVQRQLSTQKLNLQALNQTKDHFFGIIAHDLRSPMTALQSVKMQINYHLQQQDLVALSKLGESITNTMSLLNRLLDNLLNWALSQSGHLPYQPSPVGLTIFAREAAALFQEVAQFKQIKLLVHGADKTMAHADQHAVHAILRNLISNAIKFTPRGGQVDLHITENETSIICTVRDNGIGIDAAKRDELFTLNTKRSQGTEGERGTGLGLLLCRELVVLNRGTLTISSTVKKGTTVTFTLPRLFPIVPQQEIPLRSKINTPALATTS